MPCVVSDANCNAFVRERLAQLFDRDVGRFFDEGAMETRGGTPPKFLVNGNVLCHSHVTAVSLCEILAGKIAERTFPR
jgi:hypothetical protein